MQLDGLRGNLGRDRPFAERNGGHGRQRSFDDGGLCTELREWWHGTEEEVVGPGA